MANPQVTAWLRHAGLSRFAPRFLAAQISVQIFLQLSPSDLDALGVDGPADRKRLADLIHDLRRTLPNIPSSRPNPILPRRSSRPALDPLPTTPADTNTDPPPHNRRLSRANSLSNTAMRTQASSPPPMARVTVCVRKRPLSRKELSAGDRDVVTVEGQVSALCVHELREKVDLTKYVETHPFVFDRVFPSHAANLAVYEGTARPLVDTLFNGGRATCFAYGQTGAGKTYTMAGGAPENPGLYTLAVRDVFDRIRTVESELWRKAELEGDDDFEPPEPAQVWISFYEIYASKLQDLLNRSHKLECREDANNEVQIVGLSHRLCEVEEDVLACIEEGSAARSTGVTGANDDSSRSHAIFQIELRHPPNTSVETDPSTVMKQVLLRNTRSRTAAAAAALESRRGAEIGRLCFIDLAGSERGSDTASSTRQTRMEGAEINKSLLALKECIRAMDQRKDHTPFRGSKLTQVLKASFMGKNCRTVMIANISPASSNVEHTLNTLRYSDRVKEIKKDRAGNAAFVTDAVSKSLGARRATFSHGIGMRTGRNTLGTTPLRVTQRQSPTDIEQHEEAANLLEPPALERKASKKNISRQADRPTEKDERKPALPRPTSRSSRRTTMLPARSKDSEKRLQDASLEPLSEQKATKKPRETRLRRKTSRAPSMIPSRPSLSGTGLAKAEIPLSVNTRKEKEDRRRTTAGIMSLEVPLQASGIENRAPIDDTAKASKSPCPPDHEARATTSARLEQRPMDSSHFQDSSASDVEKDHPPKKQTHRRRTIKSANAAESAMKYYMTSKKDELPDEDLLFASSENMVDAATAAAQKRLCAASARAQQPNPTSQSLLNNSGSTSGGEFGGLGKTGQAATSSLLSDDNSPSGSFSSGRSSASLTPTDALRKVVRFHHVQIEELMRLTEADVALVNAAESGQMDADEYALKLKLNLSQKLDIVKTLQSKLKLLD